MAIEKRDVRQYPLSDVIRIEVGDLTSGTAAAIADLQGGEMIVGGSVTVATAWDSGTTATLKLGDDDDDDRYTSAAVDLTTAGRTALTLTGDVMSVATELKALFEETGAAATAGEAVIEFTVLREGRQNETA